ncbi:hypothetical protein V6Z11_A10G103000 [Gossypium hirsutum]
MAWVRLSVNLFPTPGLGPESFMPPRLMLIVSLFPLEPETFIPPRVELCPSPGLGPEFLIPPRVRVSVTLCPSPPPLGPESLIPPRPKLSVNLCPTPGLGPEVLMPPRVRPLTNLCPSPGALGPDPLIAPRYKPISNKSGSFPPPNFRDIKTLKGSLASVTTTIELNTKTKEEKLKKLLTAFIVSEANVKLKLHGK